MPTLNLVPASTEDFRRLAERRLPRFLFDYVDGGAYQEVTLRENVEDFQRVRLKQRVLIDASAIDTTATVLGEKLSMPLALSPIGLGGMTARRGETQAKRAADALGVPFCLSTVGICSLEEVAAVSQKPFWFQLYMLRDRGPVKELLQRAKNAGVSTLVFTVDLAVVGARYRDVRNGMTGAGGAWGRLRSGAIAYLLHPGWTFDVGVNGKPHVFGNLADYVPDATNPNGFREWIESQIDPSVTWKDIEWLRSIWGGKLVIKGVLSREDAAAAADCGADAIVVSNHGGRQLDGVASSIAVLPRIVDAVGARTEILVDGGVRSGQDVLKARALGAAAAMIGRPWVYALAAKGENGVRQLLSTLKGEMKVSMTLTGAPVMNEVTTAILDT
ncbi:MAG: L-lactate dehydrogenase [Parvularculaceae bacterium]|nr:L-lactate dehydrogenase [Parvularculaceae bacterium]